MLSAEYVGEEYFDALARKSFFCCMLETDPSTGDQDKYYVLHNLMHDSLKVNAQEWTMAIFMMSNTEPNTCLLCMSVL